ncbi:4Fe-4S binding protein [archaeon]|nr:4Fe-4S binding protein [archaeon]
METTIGGIIYEPGSSAKTKTGDWRTFKPIFDNEKCKRCGICQKFCPEGIISINEQGAKANMDYCKGCGICAEECPFKAITMEVEKK